MFVGNCAIANQFPVFVEPLLSKAHFVSGLSNVRRCNFLLLSEILLCQSQIGLCLLGRADFARRSNAVVRSSANSGLVMMAICTYLVWLHPVAASPLTGVVTSNLLVGQ